MRKWLAIALLLLPSVARAQTLDIFGGRVDSVCTPDPTKLPPVTTFSGVSAASGATTVVIPSSNTTGWVNGQHVKITATGSALDTVMTYTPPGGNTPTIASISPNVSITLTLPAALGSTVTAVSGNILPTYWHAWKVTTGPAAGSYLGCDPLYHWIFYQAGSAADPFTFVGSTILTAKYGSTTGAKVTGVENRMKAVGLTLVGEDSNTNLSSSGSFASSTTLPLMSPATISLSAESMANFQGRAAQSTVNIGDAYSTNIDPTIPFLKAPGEALPDVFSPYYTSYANATFAGQKLTNVFQAFQAIDDTDGVSCSGAGPDFHSNFGGKSGPHTNCNPAYAVMVSSPVYTLSASQSYFPGHPVGVIVLPDPKNYTKDAGSYVPFQAVVSTNTVTGSSSATPSSLTQIYQGMYISGNGIPAGTKITSINELAGTIAMSNAATTGITGVSLTYSSSQTTVSPASCAYVSGNRCDLDEYLTGATGSIYTGFAALNTAWGLAANFYDSNTTDGTSHLGMALTPAADGTTTTFTATLGANVDPHSMLLTWNGIPFAGDCPQWAKDGTSTCPALVGQGLILSETVGSPATITGTSSTINYGTGALSVTFATAPPSGTDLRVFYISGGWPRGGPGGGGKGPMDADGSDGGNGTGIGTNGVCFVSSLAPGGAGTCAEGDYKVFNAQAQAGTDLDGYVAQYAAQYAFTARSAIDAADGMGATYSGLNLTGAWNSPANKGWYQGESLYADMLFSGAVIDGANQEFAAKTAFMEQYAPHIPLIKQGTIGDQQQPNRCGTGPFCASTVQGKGLLWYNSIVSDLAPNTFDGLIKYAGVTLWAPWPCSSGCGGDQSAYGIFTNSDNLLNTTEDVSTAGITCGTAGGANCGSEPVAPTVAVGAPSAGGSLPVGVQATIEITYADWTTVGTPRYINWMESAPSAIINETTATTSGNQTIVVTSPPAYTPAWGVAATNYNVYAATCATAPCSPLTLQNTTPIALGTNFSWTAATTTGVNPPNYLGTDALGCISGCSNTTGMLHAFDLWKELSVAPSKPTGKVRGIIWSKGFTLKQPETTEQKGREK